MKWYLGTYLPMPALVLYEKRTRVYFDLIFQSYEVTTSELVFMKLTLSTLIKIVGTTLFMDRYRETDIYPHFVFVQFNCLI